MTTPPDIASLIPARTLAPTTGLFSVATIPGSPHLVGRDDQGRACILLSSSDSGVRPPVRLGGLDVQYALTCTVRISKTAEARVLSVVTSTNNSAEDERYFLHVMGALLDLVGEIPSLDDLARAITELAGIFQKLGRASRESVIGIVGELVLIAVAANPSAAVAAWRVDPDDRYDFSADGLRLEVKSTSSRRRSHSFSFEQCDVPSGCHGVVASVFIEQTSGSLSVEGLLHRIAARLTRSPQDMFRVEQTLASTLGADLPDALSFRFDFELACAELAFFDLRTIPAIRAENPPLVSQVRFTSDLSSTSPIEVRSFMSMCPAFATFVATL